jgi:hypothetical protein
MDLSEQCANSGKKKKGDNLDFQKPIFTSLLSFYSSLNYQLFLSSKLVINI